MRASVEKCAGVPLVLLDCRAGGGLENAADQDLHIDIVTAVMLRDDTTEPGIVSFVGGLPWLARAQRNFFLRHGSQSLQNEPEFDGHGLLAPKRAVVIEHGNSLFHRYKRRAIWFRDP